MLIDIIQICNNAAYYVTIESQTVAARPAATGTPKTTAPNAPRLKISLALPKHANVQLLAPDNTLVAQAIQAIAGDRARETERQASRTQPAGIALPAPETVPA